MGFCNFHRTGSQGQKEIAIILAKNRGTATSQTRQYHGRNFVNRSRKSKDLKENARFPFVPAGPQCEQIPDLYYIFLNGYLVNDLKNQF